MLFGVFRRGEGETTTHTRSRKQRRSNNNNINTNNKHSLPARVKTEAVEERRHVAQPPELDELQQGEVADERGPRALTLGDRDDAVCVLSGSWVKRV